MSVLNFKVDRPPIRHIISLDGTWQSENSEDPTNIKLLHDSLAERGEDGMLQRKAYFDGVATDGGVLKRAWNAVTGGDLEEKIREAYEYLAVNYKPGDEIVLVGFSRGAYTARSLNGMIYKSGIIADADKMQPEELKQRVQKAFDFYRNSIHPKDEQAVNHRAHNSYNDNPKVGLGIFDTVDELGIPKQFIIGNAITRWRYKFHDDKLNENTKFAVNAVAIDEQRPNYEPTPMTLAEQTKTYLDERYFIGDHGAVGGGSKENRGLSDIAGKWMSERLSALGGIGFVPAKIAENFNPNPLANPNTDFKPESKFWKFLGLERREIPQDAVLDPSVSVRFNKMANYRPDQLEGRIPQTMIAEGQGIEAHQPKVNNLPYLG